jgi:8-oxo-dGTP pyrophosphatase MutT (NUDIX family)
MSDELPPWRVHSSRLVVDDHWLRLRADSCETAEGVTIAPFYVVETADVAASVAVTRRQELVLVRQYRHGYQGVTLELPAGRVDAQEDPVTAARRELREETGYTSGDALALRPFSPNTLRYTNRLHTVLLTNVEPGAAANDPTETIEVVLWPLARAEELYVHPDFANANFAGSLAIGLQALRHASWLPGDT